MIRNNLFFPDNIFFRLHAISEAMYKYVLKGIFRTQSMEND